jgi:hypothetical protein
MLLQLLNHHQELLLAAIWPLICARNAASLAAIGGTCTQLRAFLAAEVPLLAHMVHFRSTVKYISQIEKIILVDNDGNCSTIINVHGKITCYVQFMENVLDVYSGGRELHDVDNYIIVNDLDHFAVGAIDTDNLHGPIFETINNTLDIDSSYYERILDIKISSNYC